MAKKPKKPSTKKRPTGSGNSPDSAIPPVLGELDDYLINEGRHERMWEVLGAHVIEQGEIPGLHFAVWAPNASVVSVVGDFNYWNGDHNKMVPRGSTGVWETFIAGLGEGEVYKYQIRDGNGRLLPQKADPFGFGAEHPPKTASVVRSLNNHVWGDED